jgi:hypothetical protein
MTDYRGLIREVPRKHRESRSVPGRCRACLETWPCLTARLAEALEQEIASEAVQRRAVWAREAVDDHLSTCDTCDLSRREAEDGARCDEYNRLGIAAGEAFMAANRIGAGQELLDALSAAQARSERLAGALEWYAAEDNYLGHCPAALDDLGAQARAALGVVPRGDHPALTTPPICGNTGLTEAVEAGFRSIRASKGESPDGGCGKQLGWLHAYRCLECGRWMHAECLRQHFAEHGDALSLAQARVERLAGELERQWEYNHSEHCGGPLPHPGRCHWPRPAVLDESAALGLAAHKDLASPPATPDGFSE